MNEQELYREVIADYIEREIEVLIALQSLVDQEHEKREEQE